MDSNFISSGKIDNLDMDNATFGRSTEGKAALLAELEAEKRDIIGTIGYSGYCGNLFNMIQKYWSGSDARKFEKQLSDSIQNMTNVVTKQYNVVSKLINNDYNQFLKFQNKNY